MFIYEEHKRNHLSNDGYRDLLLVVLYSYFSHAISDSSKCQEVVLDWFEHVPGSAKKGSINEAQGDEFTPVSLFSNLLLPPSGSPLPVGRGDQADLFFSELKESKHPMMVLFKSFGITPAKIKGLLISLEEVCSDMDYVFKEGMEKRALELFTERHLRQNISLL